MPHILNQHVFQFVRRFGQTSGDGAQKVYCGKPAAFGDLAIQHHMPVENTPQDIGDRLFHVRSGDKHAEDGGDVPRTLDTASGPFGQSHDLVCDRRGVASQRRQFAGGNGHLAMRLGEARDRIGHVEHVLALIAKMLGNRHGGQRATAPFQRRTVGRRGDNDTALHPFRAEHLGHEIENLAASFTDKRKDDHVRLHALSELREKA